MKKFVFVLLAFALLAVPFTVNAGLKQDYSEVVTVLPDEVIDGDFMAAGERVDIHGTILGDVYVVGGIVNIDGIVEGDVLVLGGDVTIAGEIGQDLRAIGGQIVITGTVQRNITAVGGSVKISRSAEINRNVYIGSGAFYMAGAIDGDLFYATDPEQEILAETASVSGTITKHEFSEGSFSNKAKNKQMMKEVARGFGIFAMLVSVISTLILGFLIVKLLPKYSDRASELILTSFGKSFLIGLASFILFPLAIVFLFATIVGIPIALIMLAILVVYGFIARIYVMIALGKKLEQVTKVKLSGKYYTFILGLTIYYLLSLIPIFGGLVKGVVLIAGFGAAIRNIRNTYFIARGKKVL